MITANHDGSFSVSEAECPHFSKARELGKPCIYCDPAAPVEGLPECPNYIAHPQSVWFNEHWRPAFERVKRDKDMWHRLCLDANDAACREMKANEKLTARVAELELHKEQNFETALRAVEELSEARAEIARILKERE